MPDAISAELVRQLLRESEERISSHMRDLWTELKSDRDEQRISERDFRDRLMRMEERQKHQCKQFEEHMGHDAKNFSALRLDVSSLKQGQGIAHSAGAEAGARAAKKWGTGVGLFVVGIFEGLRMFWFKR